MALRCVYLLFFAITSVLSIQHQAHTRRTPSRAHMFHSRHAASNESSLLSVRDTPIPAMHDRRVSSIISSITTNNDQISGWISSLDSDGKWPDVNYATGCAAQRANWPAQSHWQRLRLISGAWHGGVPNASTYDHDTRALAAVLLGMDWWFTRDFTNVACLDHGGTDKCPCSSTDTTLWNTNWYSNVIGIPSLVIQTCLLLDNALPQRTRDHCAVMTSRSYGTFNVNPPPGYLSGANILDIARIAIDQGLLTSDPDLLISAYNRAHNEIAIKSTIRADGIRNDGSFGQHGGLLYNGNYGKDYANAVIDLELIAVGTQFAAANSSRAALDSLFDGNRWMVFYNTLSGIIHWDFSVLPRFISFPVADQQATGGLKIDLKAVADLGAAWNASSMKQFATLKDSNSNANVGSLNGNRMFYANDYMVHRGNGYVSTLKMYSSRTSNTECTNSQNPFGFHLADGSLYTYQHGNEYEDIAAAWDWDMIPGSTVDYKATPLSCDRASFTGISPFVGGVSTGTTGIAAMRYVNPYTKTLQYQKTWFFLGDDIQHVMVSGLTSTSGAPIYTVLDQKRHSGNVAVDTNEAVAVPSSKTVSQPGASSLWHDGVGYTFDSQQPTTLNFQVGRKTGNWSAIGISTQPPADVDLFSAWLQHHPESLDVPISYTIFPSVDRTAFVSKSSSFKLQSTVNNAHVSAVYDQSHDTAMFVFWDVGGGQASLDISSAQNPNSTLLVQVNGNAAVIYDRPLHRVLISDPSQTLDALEVKLTVTTEGKPTTSKSVIVPLPRNGLAGSTQVVGI